MTYTDYMKRLGFWTTALAWSECAIDKKAWLCVIDLTSEVNNAPRTLKANPSTASFWQHVSFFNRSCSSIGVNRRRSFHPPDSDTHQIGFALASVNAWPEVVIQGRASEQWPSTEFGNFTLLYYDRTTEQPCTKSFYAPSISRYECVSICIASYSYALAAHIWPG